MQPRTDAAFDSEEVDEPKIVGSEWQTADKRLAHAQPTDKYAANVADSGYASEGEDVIIQAAPE